MTTKNSIAFDCHTCGRGIVRDSEEHDHSCCDEDNEDNWYCCECFHDFIVKKEASQQAPKCDTKNCECFAAKNKYYPNSEGGEFWTLCEKCYKEDQEEDEEEENMTTCYGCDELFDNDDLRGICQREDCKIHQWDDGCSDHRVLCKDCYVNNNPAAEEHEEATHDCNQCSYSLTSKEFYAGKGRIMFSEGDGIKEGEYKCDECHKKKKKKKRKRLVIVDKPKWHQKCSKCDNIKHDCDWVYCLENRAYCGDCSPSSSCDLTYCQACH